MYKLDCSEQKPYKLFMKSIAHAELKEIDCCNTHLVSWNPDKENNSGVKQLQNVVHRQDYLVLKDHTWLDDSCAASGVSPLTANSLHELGDVHIHTLVKKE